MDKNEFLGKKKIISNTKTNKLWLDSYSDQKISRARKLTVQGVYK
jgi:hypothetical protein